DGEAGAEGGTAPGRRRGRRGASAGRSEAAGGGGPAAVERRPAGPSSSLPRPHHPGPLLPTPPPSLTGRRGRHPFGVALGGWFPSPGEGGWEGSGEGPGVR